MSKNDKIDVVPTKEDDASPENKVPVTSAATQEDSDQEDTVEFEEGKSSILRKRTNEMREKMRLLLEEMDEEQLERYDFYRKSSFPKAAMKKTVQSILNHSVNPNMLIVICGVAKVFVGEIVEEAKKVMSDWGDDPNSAILPSHIREAHRRIKRKGSYPQNGESLGKRNLVH